MVVTACVGNSQRDSVYFPIPLIQSVCDKDFAQTIVVEFYWEYADLPRALKINVCGEFEEGQTKWIMLNWKIENGSYTKLLCSPHLIKG